jgi:hypothetical protein
MAKKGAKKPPTPAWTNEQVRALIASGDPRTAEAVAGYNRHDVGEILIDLYRLGTEFARAATMDALKRVRFGRGYWQAAKRIYKSAEQSRDAAFFGYLAYRIDADEDYSRHLTRDYMRRRAWRFLRRMARQSPTNYPYFAAEVLIHYRPADVEGSHGRYRWAVSDVWLGHEYSKWPDGKYRKLERYTIDTALRRWVLGNILHRNNRKLRRGKTGFQAGDHKFPAITPDSAVAFPDLWKRSPEPLLHVAANANYEPVRAWAIGRLKADHAEALRALPVEAALPFLRSRHEPAALFGWEILTAGPPEQVNTEALVGALLSPHASVTAKAAEFILWHRKKGWLPVPRWVILAVGDHAAAAEFAAKWLRNQHGEDLGWGEIARLLEAKLPAVRALGVEILTARPALVAFEPVAFAAALDTPHDDIRPGLCALIDSAGLNAAAAFALLELPYVDVQTAARGLIEKHLAEWNTPDYLLSAAESPDDGVMHWAAGLVMARLAEDGTRLRALVPFFRRLLYRVNTGSPVKRKLLGFLRQTAERFPEQAAPALALLSEFTRSIGKREFAAALTAAVKLSVERPELGERLRAELPGLRIEDEVIR